MKQLCVTSCVLGRSVNGASGFQIRALSAGISEQDQQAMRGQATYLLPKGYPQETSMADAPVRFSYLKLQNGRRILLRANYVGQDPMTQRYNNYFAHVVTDLPAGFTAGHAIKTWESVFWRRQDFEGPSTLGDFEQIPEGPFIAQYLVDFANSQKDLVKFILTMLLFGPANARVRLAAKPHHVALCVAVTAQCLPPSLREDLTFSTYEYDPDTSFAKIVGTCWHESLTHDLPATAYQDNGGGYNTFTGKHASLSTSSSFVDAAVEAIANQRGQELEAFFRFWSELQSKDFTLLDLAYRVFTNQVLTIPELQRAAQTPTLLARWLQSPVNYETLWTWSFQDATMRTTVWPVAAGLLRTQQPKVHVGFVERIWQSGLVAWTRADGLEPGRILIEEMLPAVDDGKIPILKQLLQRVDQPGVFPWEVKEHLLGKFAAAGMLPRTDPGLVAWLRVPADQLSRLLQSPKLNDEFRQTAGLESLLKIGLTETVLAALQGAKTLAWELFLLLAREEKERTFAVEYWLALLKNKYPKLLEQTLEMTAQQKDFAEICVTNGIRKKLIDPVAFVRVQGVTGMRRFSSVPLLQTVAAAVGNECLKKDAWDATLLAFLQDGRSQKWFPEEEQGPPLLALLLIDRFLEKPMEYRDRLSEVAESLQQLVKTAVRKTAQRKVADELPNLLLQVAQADPMNEPNARLFLENLLVHFGSGVAGNPAAVFDGLWKTLSGVGKTWKTPGLIAAFAALVFGQCTNPELAKRLHGKPGISLDAMVLLKLIDRKSPDLMEALDQASKTWGPGPREKWHESYHQHLRSTRDGRSGLLLNIVFIGVAAVTAIFFWEALIRPNVPDWIWRLFP